MTYFFLKVLRYSSRMGFRLGTFKSCDPHLVHFLAMLIKKILLQTFLLINSPLCSFNTLVDSYGVVPLHSMPANEDMG